MGAGAAVKRALGGLAGGVKETFTEFLADSPFQAASALSFYTLLSLSPLLLMVVGVAGLVFGADAVEGQLLGEMRDLVGREGAEAIQTIIANSHHGQRDVLSTIVGAVTLVIGATTVFVQLQASLNQIWDVRASTERVRDSITSFFRQRLLSFAMVLAIGFLLIVSLVVNAALTAVDAYLARTLPGGADVWRYANAGVTLVLITSLIALMFKFLPDRRIPWRDVWLGAGITGVLLTLGKYLIGLYLGQATFASAFGAAASLVVLMVWIYYASLILFFGAEVTQVYARRRRGTLPPPSPHAVPDAR
jgi:membrane protein